MDEIIIVYCKIDEQNRITAVNSSIFISDTNGWLELDSSDSNSRHSRDSYAHAQGNYFSDDIIDDNGVHRYIYDESLSPKYREATQEEMETEMAEILANQPTPEPTEMEKMRADLDYVMLMNGLDVDPQ